MSVMLNFITGCMVGFEIVSGEELEESGTTFVVVDIFIVRFTFVI